MPDLTAPVVAAGRLREQTQPRLITDELVMRPWDAADAGGVVEAYGDPDIQHWHARSMTLSEALQWVASRGDRWRAEIGADWAIADGQGLLGRVGLRGSTCPRAGRRRSIGCCPQRAAATSPRGHWARSPNGRSAELGLHRIELVRAVANQASCRVADKAGHLAEGTKRQQTLHADGWHDMHLHARLRSDR